MKTVNRLILPVILLLLCAAAFAQGPLPPEGSVAPPAGLAVTANSNPTPVPDSLDSLVGQPVTHFNFLTLVVGYLAVTLIGLFGLIILWRIYTGRIDISLLISEQDGSASLSRFQFLIFTFVISLSLLLVILGSKGGPQFPQDIPAGIYALLGISAASYVVSNGIQKNIDQGGGDYPARQ